MVPYGQTQGTSQSHTPDVSRLLHRDTLEPQTSTFPFSGYTRESEFHEETKDTSGIWGLGVAILFRSNLVSMISMVRQDTYDDFL